jgi:ATP-binding cassette, subfamily B, bacterial MsbA
MPSESSDHSKTRKSFRESIQEVWGPYSQLLPYLKPYRGRFVLGLIFGALGGVVSGTLGLVIKHVSDQVFPSGGGKAAMMKLAQEGGIGPGIEKVLWVCALIPAVMILRSVLSYLNAYCMAWVSLKLLVDIRTDLFAHIIRQSLDFFNKARAGNLISRVSNDTRQAQAALTQVSSDLVTQPFTIVTAIIVLLKLDWKFTLISLVLFPVCLVPIVVYGRRVRKSGRDEEAGAGEMMVILSEALAGIKVIKALGRENFEAKCFQRAGHAQFDNSIRVRKSIEIVGPMIEAVAAVGVGMALVYVYFAHIGAAKFLGLVTALFMLYEPTKKLSRVHVQLQKCLASTTRIFELMQMQPSVRNAPGAIPLTDCRGAITLKNVTFGYGNAAAAVREINLDIEPGKTYALVGESGAGKSTLLALILRFYDPTRGTVSIDGRDLRELTQKSLRENVAIVTQETFLFHESIFNNIQYGRRKATAAEVYEAARQAYAHDFILAQPKGYDTVIGDKGCMLSGGQQQRIAIARALLKNAPILLLDEAMSALDSESERQVQRAIEALATGRTVVAIAHRLSTILKADQIVVMEHGMIQAIGPHRELYEKSGLYRKLYDLQFHGDEEPEASFSEAVAFLQ